MEWKQYIQRYVTVYAISESKLENEIVCLHFKRNLKSFSLKNNSVCKKEKWLFKIESYSLNCGVNFCLFVDSLDFMTFMWQCVDPCGLLIIEID